MNERAGDVHPLQRRIDADATHIDKLKGHLGKSYSSMTMADVEYLLGRLGSLDPEERVHALNATGEMYLTHTKLDGRFTLRMSIGQSHTQEHHVRAAWVRIVKATGTRRDKS